MTTTRYLFPRAMRLTGARSFRAVYAEKVKVVSGPLVVWGRPNGLDHLRLGLAVGRRVGNAVIRNRIKRRVREAFRMMQHDFPVGYDVVVAARPHDPLPLANYQRALSRSVQRIHRQWTPRTES